MKPPKLADQLLKLFCSPHRLEEVQGDLHEEFAYQVRRVGERRARRQYWWDVIGFMKPFAIKRKSAADSKTYLMNPIMIRNYFKIAWRNLVHNKGYSAINIVGLSVGMAVAMLIGLWVYDELSFNKYHQNYDRIAQVRSFVTDPATGISTSGESMQFPMGAVLKTQYKQYFKHILMGFWVGNYTVSAGDKKINKMGEFIEAAAPEMFSLKMIKGSYSALKDLHTTIISRSMAEAFFGDKDPLNQLLKIDNRIDVKVTGVYEDLPRNSRFYDVGFFAPWDLWVSSNKWIKDNENSWDNSSFNIYVELNPGISWETVAAGTKNLYSQSLPKEISTAWSRYKPELYLYPMRKWHLFSEFKNGRPTTGRITFVWLFGIIGAFVLLLACINFVNLSTARSEKRGKEVGIRKAIGSVKGQLVFQFLSESFLVVLLAFVLSMVLINLSLSSFNELADKAMSLPLTNPYFWAFVACFIVLSGAMAGLYPAFYLSSFQPVKVLKGAIRLGRFAALPRKILVVVQFTVSVVLIIGTIVVYQQIQYARNRPVGYNREGLITVSMNDPNYKGKYELLKSELVNTSMVTDVALSSSPLTAIWSNSGGFNWRGKDPEKASNFSVTEVTHDLGKMVGWKFIAGRNFSKEFATDSAAVIINEAAANYIGLKSKSGNGPVGEFIKTEDGKQSWQIIGVIKDVVTESPYDPVRRGFYFLDYHYTDASQMVIKMKSTVSANAALPEIGNVFKRLVPSASFDYKFVDDEYATKFSAEQRVGKLANLFAILAIFISCLGLFGLASFVAEQRTKEIGIRKVLGASVANLWQLLSKDFVILVIISCLVAAPIAWYFMSGWLQKYEYRTEISWWIFIAAGFGALAITLLTVSYQAIRAALMNPVNSLRSE
jgi:putative ABC transport system permease protein